MPFLQFVLEQHGIDGVGVFGLLLGHQRIVVVMRPDLRGVRRRSLERHGLRSGKAGCKQNPETEDGKRGRVAKSQLQPGRHEPGTSRLRSQMASSVITWCDAT